MAINLKNEELFTLTQAAKYLPKISQRKVNVSTLWRWCKEGLWGNYLEYLNIGRNIFTSTEALERFFILLALTKIKPNKYSSNRPKVKKTKTSAKKQQSIEDARVILIRAKILPGAQQNAASI